MAVGAIAWPRMSSLPATSELTGRRRVRDWIGDRLLLVLTAGASLAAVVLIGLIAYKILHGAHLAFSSFGLSFVKGKAWDANHKMFGALPGLYGTAVTSLIALVIATPLALAIALFLSELAPTWARVVVGSLVETLAAIPSVVYGIWALYVLGPWTFDHIETPVSDRFGFIGWLSSPSPRSLFTASLVLAVMILPTLTAVSRDVIRAVPRGMKENAVALGATWWETNWRVILPSARSGIIGATILALGRALGETIAVTMIIGNNYQIPPSIFSPAYTLASVIANEFTEATGVLYPAALVELGLVLILVTLTLNVIAMLLVRSTAARAAI